MLRRSLPWMAAAALGALAVVMGVWAAGVMDVFTARAGLPGLLRGIIAAVLFAGALSCGLLILFFTLRKMRDEDGRPPRTEDQPGADERERAA